LDAAGHRALGSYGKRLPLGQRDKEKQRMKHIKSVSVVKAEHGACYEDIATLLADPVGCIVSIIKEALCGFGIGDNCSSF
jgi:hypothetical protein